MAAKQGHLLITEKVPTEPWFTDEFYVVRLAVLTFLLTGFSEFPFTAMWLGCVHIMPSYFLYFFVF